jgi:trimethylamine:corrinoid methyltransferase-like protein
MKMAFDLPSHTYGSGSDAPALDAQCMSERALQAFLMAVSGADVLGAAGQLEVATTISPLQLIIDDEVFGMIRGIILDMALNDDTMAWTDLKDCEPGAQFLTNAHTFDHCRDAATPKNFTRLGREAWENQGKKDLVDRAGEAFKGLMKDAGPLALPKETVQEMERIVQTADKNI